MRENHVILSVVIGTYNRLDFLRLTIESVRNELKGINTAIIVVDGGSTDGSIRWLSKQKDIITIIQHNRGEWLEKEIKRKSWGYFMNLGFKVAKGKYVCMLSDDCLVVPGAIKNGINLFEMERDKGNKVGAVAFYWRNWPEQKKYWVGLTLGNKMFVNHGLYFNQALKEVNYIDEENYNFYHADGDLCLKIWKKGYRIIDSKTSFIEHYSHANSGVRSSNMEKQKEDWSHYLEKWSGEYYKVARDNQGGWIEKEFIDKNNTANKFLKNLPVLKRIKIKIS
ncbi:MAG: hypothetical protein UT08_C0001G0027 [Candidatus Woesebacteria bacterium GW2011_GWB1_38_8]|uniref:Glycosyltransferase 2-like domain-containing protein n=1 Tax=Candidatus Woesebacteria bacterium GW2011_GWB1_38_8 TaxID=1618570 RepID=A0A0G0PA45_9BACT|nr:MAG: hypothetical protein UT08_C0001G0027 [Candidatus Woesebacteria bacterium GW2011_GWB1_38_8]